MLTNTTAAVIVTFNRLQLLQECIAALRNQARPLDEIIVINNSSTDGTEKWLLAQPDIVTVTQENKGGAYGFYTGIKTAFENKNEWIWCMDDDGVPDANALAELLKHEQRKPCVMNALVLDKDNHDRIVFKTGKYTLKSEINEKTVENAANFFNGTLFHYEVINKVGFPLKELTIWGDEKEYYNRILFKYKFPVFTVTDSFHYHPAQYSQFYKKEWDLKTGWKIYFYIRNKNFELGSKYNSKPRVFFSYGVFLFAFLGTIFVYQKHGKLKKTRLLIKAGRDGLLKDTSRVIKETQQLLQTL